MPSWTTRNKRSQPESRDAARWNAIQHRDPKADDLFYYSVQTTGVYCRPSCAARLPRRENISFHLTREAAEAAGFRACKRCRPNEPTLTARRASAIEAACRGIENSDELPNFDDLAEA